MDNAPIGAIWDPIEEVAIFHDSETGETKKATPSSPEMLAGMLKSMPRPTLYVVGRRNSAGLEWSIRGVFGTREKAVAVCRSVEDFVAPITLNADAGEHAAGEWPGLAFPVLDAFREGREGDLEPSVREAALDYRRSLEAREANPGSVARIHAGALARLVEGKSIGEAEEIIADYLLRREAQNLEAVPLAGEWRYSDGYLCSGTLRIAREDFDTDPAPEFKSMVFEWICATLNKANPVETFSPLESDLVEGLAGYAGELKAETAAMRQELGGADRSNCNHSTAGAEVLGLLVDRYIDSSNATELKLVERSILRAELVEFAQWYGDAGLATLLETIGDLVYRAAAVCDKLGDRDRWFDELVALRESVVNARRLDGLGAKLARVCDAVEKSPTAERVAELEAGILRIDTALREIRTEAKPAQVLTAFSIIDRLLPEAGRALRRSEVAKPSYISRLAGPFLEALLAAKPLDRKLAGEFSIALAREFSSLSLAIVAEAQSVYYASNSDARDSAVEAFEYLEKTFAVTDEQAAEFLRKVVGNGS